ncbi:MAG: hypothetical protein JWM64_2018 [Frankiales bacterium]|nr:hypothetical protein [Frankiales bacterium]
MTASSLTLLDEELGLLVAGDLPLPWLEAVAPEERDAALRSSARSLLVRGLAEVTDEGLQPSADLRPWLAPLTAGGHAVQLVVAVDGQQQLDHTVLHCSGDDVLVQDVSSDGVHLLTRLSRADVAVLLRSALDPLRLADDVDEDVLLDPGDLSRPDAVAKLSSSDGQDLAVVTAAGVVWCLRSAPRGPEPVLTRLDPVGLDRLVAGLLGP